MLAFLACSGSEEAVGPLEAGATGLRLAPVVGGLDQPVYLTSPAGDDRLFIVEQPGRIRIVQSGLVRATPFLDIADVVRSGGERGLLSLAFHPDYASNGFFYVYYTEAPSGRSNVSRFTVSADPSEADRNTAELLLTVDQPFANHNGGLIAFGPDDMLYIGLGDGGSGGDPQGNGQDPGTLLGSLLRVDVNGGPPFAVPPDNPFVGVAGARDEIWAYGLRNPWRYAFDAVDGWLYIADVGQSAFEEVNVVVAADGGLNFGWNVMEASSCFGVQNCDQAGLELPLAEYAIPDDGCAVIGGYVYRGSAIPAVRGHYFYSDYCGGWLRSFRYASGVAADGREWDVTPLQNVQSFGRDAAGELYILVAGGDVFQIVPDP